ncbi:MAG: 16S rRNA processing protein RimM [Bacteroidales bacterium]|nr:16S rRNA processing protein RimM [Bacteroidales bacterium]
MILPSEIEPIGQFGKPHGINGEINLSLNMEISPDELSCVIMDIDGINVPFFFKSVRNRGVDSYLVFIDGVNTEYEASAFVNKTVYALKSELPEKEEDEDGFYAEDLIGFKVIITDSDVAGTITDIDDNTANILFIIRTDDGKQILIPVAEEFIESIDTENKTIEMNIPDGLINL